MYASKTRKEKFSGPDENCQRYVTDLAGSLVTSSRPPGRLQKRRDGRTRNAGVAVQTADGSRRTADAGDEQCLRCGCSSPSCTVVLCAADVDGPLHTACTAPPRNVQPVQLVVLETAESAVCVPLRRERQQPVLNHFGQLVFSSTGGPRSTWYHLPVSLRTISNAAVFHSEDN